MTKPNDSLSGVKRAMKEKIMNYLTLKRLLDREFQSQPNQRIKSAYLLARKDYDKLTEDQKKEIITKIENAEGGR